MALKHANMIIDGELRKGTGQEFPVHNPATGEVIGTARDATLNEIKEACSVARAAWKYWAYDRTPIQAKEQVFETWRTLLEENRFPIAWDMAEECGKALEECIWDVRESMDTCRHYAKIVTEAHRGRIDTAQLKNKSRETKRKPVGVIASATPFNFPLAVPFWKMCAALAGGNSMVLKAAEQTPFTATAGIQLLMQTLKQEFSDNNRHLSRIRGIVNLLHGRGDTGDKTGVNLVEHGDYDLFKFTGGVETGRKIGAVCGNRLKPFHPELGGHARIVILSDYVQRRGLDKAVGEVVRGAMGTNAQRCVTTRGGFVEHDIFWPAVKRHIEMARAWKIGDPRDPATKFGPLIEESAVQKCEQVVNELAHMGYYPVLAGGYRLCPETVSMAKRDGFNFDESDFSAGGRLAKGYFFLPAVYVNLPKDARPVKEEVFGPIFFYNEIPVTSHAHLSEFSQFLLNEHLEIERGTPEWYRMALFLYAMELINESDDGLSNAILTTDLVEARLAAELVESGIFYIGRGTTGAEVPGKFGGIKCSGFGRDGEGVEDSTYEMTIWEDRHPSVRMAQSGDSTEKLVAWVENKKREKEYELLRESKKTYVADPYSDNPTWQDLEIFPNEAQQEEHPTTATDQEVSQSSSAADDTQE